MVFLFLNCHVWLLCVSFFICASILFDESKGGEEYLMQIASASVCRFIQVTFFGYNLPSKQCLAMGICLHQTGGDY